MTVALAAGGCKLDSYQPPMKGKTMDYTDMEDVRECGGCEDSENHPHAFDCERA